MLVNLKGVASSQLSRFRLPTRRERQYAGYRRKYEIDSSFRFLGEGTLIYGAGKIKLGANSYVGEWGHIQSYDGCLVEIGKGCAISHYFAAYTHNDEPDQDFSQTPLRIKTGNVRIGDYCWLGYRVYVNQGVTIGENSVIGAGSVVVKDIPAYSIAAGVPCKVIRRKSCSSRVS